LKLRFVSTLAAIATLALFSHPVYATTLFGNAEHSEALPNSNGDQINTMLRKRNADLVQQQAAMAQASPVQGKVAERAPLQAVATFDKPAVEWFMIPRWLAGRWHKKGDLTVGVTDLLTGHKGMQNVWVNNELSTHWGHQVDRNGNIWHANFIPTTRDGDSDGEVVRFVTVAEKCELTTPEQVVTRTHYVVTKALEANNEVVEKYQQESLNDYTMTAQGGMENRSSNKLYHMNGQAYRMGLLESQFSKIAEFAPTAFDRGIDMRKSLVDYLHSQHLDNLVPEATSM